ncbi:MAG TPA: DPP IV N-terminal domain-containing protein [Fimbriimonadaceae bacterium]|nr:DPP IV N-terminal domain-containing protein [Fimbriimonadaceae bacterium]
MRRSSVLLLTVLSLLPLARAQLSPEAAIELNEKLLVLPWTSWTDSNRLLVHRPESKELLKLDPKTGTWATVVRAAQLPRAVEFAPVAATRAGDTVLFPKGSGVYAFSLTTRKGHDLGPGFAHQISPDGRRVAFLRERDLYVHELASGKTRRLTTSPRPTLLNGKLSWVYWEEIAGRRDLGFSWSPDSKTIAYLQSDEAAVNEMLFPKEQPALPEMERRRYPKAGSRNPQVRAGLLDVASGRTSWIQLPKQGWEYLTLIRWAPDSKNLALLTTRRANTGHDVWHVSAKGGVAKHLRSEVSPAWVNGTNDLRLLKDGTFLLNSQRSGRDHLYRYDKNGRQLSAVTSGAWAAGRPFFSTSGVLDVDESTGTVWLVGVAGDETVPSLFRSTLKGGLKKVSREAGAHFVSMSPDRSLYVDQRSSSNTPPSAYVCRADGSTMATISEPRTDLLATVRHRPVESIKVPARDGFQMHAQVQKPADFDPTKRYPTILHIYSGPQAPAAVDSFSWLWSYHQALNDAGYVVWIVDSRVTSITDETLPRVARGRAMFAAIPDLEDAAKWIKSQPFTDPQRLGVWGWSYGGTNTLGCLTSTREFKAGIAVAPVTDWKFYDTYYAEQLMGTPSSNRVGYEDTLWKRAKNLNGRLFLIHGTLDDNVHPQNSLLFADKLIEAGKQFDFLMYPGRDHGIGDPAATRHIFRAMYDFWLRHL